MPRDGHNADEFQTIVELRKEVAELKAEVERLKKLIVRVDKEAESALANIDDRDTLLEWNATVIGAIGYNIHGQEEHHDSLPKSSG